MANLTPKQSKIHDCEVCGSPRHHLSYCCKSCKRLLDRGRNSKKAKPDRNARLKALKQAWDGKHFRCAYTGWPLLIDVQDRKSPFYLTWEHRTPRVENDIVVAAGLVNDMKSDLTEKEFKDLIIGLAKRFKGSGEMVPLIEPEHFKR